MSQVTIEVSPNPVIIYSITNDDKIPTGYSIVVPAIKDDVKIAMLYFIYVDKEYRRQGFGRQMIEAIKVHYDEIYSQIETPEGMNLLMMEGFKIEGEFYRWKKQ